jgi:hypothetical protein
MLRIVQRFGKHCGCQLQGECVIVGGFWKPYIGQAAGGELDLMVLIGGAEERAPIHFMAGRCRLPVTPNQYTFTPRMATTMFVETLDNSQHSTRPSPESRSYTNHTSATWIG